MIHPTDLHVGQKLRTLRNAKGLSQGDVARALGISFQQIQKYECGSNRVSASKLFDIANLMDEPIASFFPAQETVAC